MSWCPPALTGITAAAAAATAEGVTLIMLMK